MRRCVVIADTNVVESIRSELPADAVFGQTLDAVGSALGSTRSLIVVLHDALFGDDLVEVCQALKHRGSPLILLLRTQPLPEGASTFIDDFCHFPGSRDELAQRLALLSCRGSQMTLDAMRLEKGKRDALHDTLTGLLSRRAVMGSLYQVYARSMRSPADLSLLFLDIDHFKRVNDVHGHHAGDRVLATVGQAIRTEVRSMDAAGRYGGEELLVVLPDTHYEEACIIAERLRRHVSETRVPSGDALLRVTVSIGGVTVPAEAFSRHQGPSPDEIIQRADALMYRAKASGRDRCVVLPFPYLHAKTGS